MDIWDKRFFLWVIRDQILINDLESKRHIRKSIPVKIFQNGQKNLSHIEVIYVYICGNF